MQLQSNNIGLNYYKKIKVVNYIIILGFLIFIVLAYVLKPIDIQIADFYFSSSAYKKALQYYKKAFTEEKNAINRCIILKRIAHIYWILKDYKNYERIIHKYYKMGGKDTDLFSKAFRVSLNLWRKFPQNVYFQNKVIFWAKVLKKDKFLKNFYLWNKRFKELLSVYEKEFQQKKFTSKDFEKVIKIAIWSGEEKNYLKWIKRYYQKIHNLRSVELLVKFYLAKKEFYKALSVIKNYPEFHNLKLLAQIYAGLKKYKKAADLYYYLYLKTKNLNYLESAYFLYLKTDPAQAEKLLFLLANYKPEYMLSLASKFLSRGLEDKALNFYLILWEKWHDFRALKTAYALAYKTRNKKVILRLINEMFKEKRE